MTIVVNGSGSTNLAYVAVQPWDYPFTFDVSGGTHTITQANSPASHPQHVGISWINKCRPMSHSIASLAIPQSCSLYCLLTESFARSPQVANVQTKARGLVLCLISHASDSPLIRNVAHFLNHHRWAMCGPTRVDQIPPRTPIHTLTFQTRLFQVWKALLFAPFVWQLAMLCVFAFAFAFRVTGYTRSWLKCWICPHSSVHPIGPSDCIQRLAGCVSHCNAIVTVASPGVSARVVRDGYDLLRRLGRVDLARHYPHLGVVDTCGPRKP
jgi:hypothetical protein